jgi:hypothetical protein
VVCGGRLGGGRFEGGLGIDGEVARVAYECRYAGACGLAGRGVLLACGVDVLLALCCG